jgi:hypothetical protein
MSRIATVLTTPDPGVPDPIDPPIDEPAPASTPARKPSKSDAAKADVANETEETP